MPPRLPFVLFLACELLTGQTSRRAPRPGTQAAGALRLPAVAFTGTLKELTGNAIVLDAGEAQPITIYRNRKTRFLRNELQVNPKTLIPGMKLTLDVATNPDGSLQAVNVIILQ